jgi:hypothetical protein
MSDRELDGAAALLRATSRVAMTVSEVADGLRRADIGPGHRPTRSTAPTPEPGCGTAALAGRLRHDDRFVVLEPVAALPGIEVWTARDRAAYARVLRQLELPAEPLVLLRPGCCDYDSPQALDRLLHRTIAGLADLPDAPALAAAAEEARAALTVITRRPRTAPSTTLPHGPPPRA